MKKLLGCFMVLVFLFQSPIVSAAVECVSDMTEQTLLAEVAEIMHHYSEDQDNANRKLEQLGFSLEGEPVTVTYATENSRAYQPSNYTITLYHTKRGSNELTHYLMWELDREWALEWNSSPLDYISLEWDTTYASYYSASTDGVVTTKKDIANGIVLFNIEDNHFGDVEYAWGSVRVNRVKAGDMLFGSKYVHTYTELIGTGTITTGLDFGASIIANAIPSLTINETRGFTVSVSGSIKSWELSETKWAEL